MQAVVRESSKKRIRYQDASSGQESGFRVNKRKALGFPTRLGPSSHVLALAIVSKFRNLGTQTQETLNPKQHLFF